MQIEEGLEHLQKCLPNSLLKEVEKVPGIAPDESVRASLWQHHENCKLENPAKTWKCDPNCLCGIMTPEHLHDIETGLSNSYQGPRTKQVKLQGPETCGKFEYMKCNLLKTVGASRGQKELECDGSTFLRFLTSDHAVNVLTTAPTTDVTTAPKTGRFEASF